MKQNPTRKDDRRTRYTKAVIQEAFFEILSEKGNFDAVSVSDICSRADINRSTFYLHYTDKYDLLRVLIKQTLEEEPEIASLAEMPLCQRLPKDEAMQNIFRNPHLSHLVSDCVYQAAKENSLSNLMQACRMDQEEAEYLLLFIVNGSLAVSRALNWEYGKLWENVHARIAQFVEGGQTYIAGLS